MKARFVLAAAVLTAGVLVASPAGALGDASVTGVDPTGDVNVPEMDITNLTASWDFNGLTVEVQTDAALPTYPGTAWEKASEDRDGLGFLIDLVPNNLPESEQYEVQVTADGAKVFATQTENPSLVPGTSFCDGGVSVTGDTLEVGIQSECLGLMGGWAVTASSYDSSNNTAQEDYAISDDTVEGSEVEPIFDRFPGGYWLAARDGGVFSFGDAEFHGSMGGKPLNKEMVGIAEAPDGNGYWTVAADGGVFAYGSARFQGSMGGKPLNAPIVSISATSTGNGYWLFAADGGVFAYGDAEFLGSMAGKPLGGPITGAAVADTDTGYWLSGLDGGVFNFGGVNYLGSAHEYGVTVPVRGIATSQEGYWQVDQGGVVGRFGGIYSYGSVPDVGVDVNNIVGIAAMPAI